MDLRSMVRLTARASREAKQPLRRLFPLFLSNLLIAAAYWSVAVLVRWYFSQYQMWPAPLWLPAGVALSAAFVLDIWSAPGILIGSFLTNTVSFHSPLFSAMMVAIGNTVAPLVAVRMGRRRIDLANAFSRVADVFWFSIICGLNGLISSAIGASSVSLSVSALWTAWPARWLEWAISDSGASLLLAPMFLLLVHDPLALDRVRGRWLELLVATATCIGTVVYLLSRNTELLAVDAGASFLVLLPLLWIAVRFSTRLAYPMFFVMMICVIVATLSGYGPYSGVEKGGTFFFLFSQMAIGFGAAVLLLGAVSEEQRTAEEALRKLNQELESRVEQRTAELRESKQRLEKVAFHDPLTGLPNRRFLEERFAAARAAAERKQGQLAFLLIDLDGFKQINDTLGHDAGDELLIETGRRLSSAVREYDFVARFGGDEFAVLLVDVPDPPQMESICSRIIQTVCHRISFNGKDVGTSPSIGVAIYPIHGDTWHEIYKAADVALYTAKRSGRCRWECYQPAVSASAPGGIT